MNKTFLVGHLTKDPELKYVNTSTAVATFTVAVNRTFTNAKGERETDFINCVVYGKPAENTKKYCSKGSLVGVDGSIQTRTYDNQDGKKVYVTEVRADNVQFLGAKTQSNGQANEQVQPSHGISDEPFAEFGETVELSEDDIAF